VTAIPGVVTSVTYDDEGRRTGYAYSNGVDVALSLDPVSRRLTEISASSAAGPIRNLNYSYDTIGNITGIGDTFNGTTLSALYTYDGLHRISGYEIRNGGPAGAVIRSGVYQLDPGGNLRRIQETSDLSLTYGDALRPGRLTAIVESAVAQPVTYDSRGRIASFDDLARIEYDALDRVSVITKADGTAIRLADDHVGHPVLREAAQGGVISRAIFAGDLYEVHGDRTVRNIYLDSIRVARETVSAAAPAAVNTSFFLTDHHGTAVLETGAAGAIISVQRYSPFGQTLMAAVELDRYIDRDLDPATGLVHFGARMYVPRIGRFLSPDWYVLENPDKPMRMPQGYNVYSYAMNNPLVFEDRGGRWFFLPFIVGFVVGLVYGLADGRGADGAWSLAKETALTTGLGFNLGWMTGMFVGGPALAGFAGAMGGVNGLFAGTRQIYDDIQFGGSLEGIASLVSDSTWGLLGTTLANAMNIYNLIAAPSSYRSDLSKGQNRQVYDRGFCFDRGFAFTQGNTISNLSGGKPQGGDPGRLLHHESTHIFQSRVFGPLFQLSYIAWLVVGGAVGLILAPIVKEDAGDAMRDVGYFDNPWEAWAYEHGGGESKKRKLAF
jgi:RHS repeat-associated protein